MTTDVVGPYLVPSGQTLTFVDQTAFELQQPAFQAAGPNLEIAGFVGVSFDTASSGAFAIRADAGSGFGQGAITIDAGGFLHVTSTAQDGAVEGILATTTGPTLINNGTIEMTGTGQITGVSAADMDIQNHGLFRVATQGLALGVYSTFHGVLTNSGTIEVSGGASAEAVLLDRVDATISNSGTITATAANGGSVGMELYTEPTKTGDLFTNTGTLAGDTALLVHSSTGWPYVMNFDNQGQMEGDVVLGNASESLSNSGAIQGTVDLGAGDDTYSGAAGQLSAALHGGDGNDLIHGDSLGDALYGDAGADTIQGGAGNDLIGGGQGSDLLDGGGGVNTVDYSDTRVSGVTLDLGAGRESDNGVSDTISNFQKVIGSNFADTITGSAANETISSGIGADSVDGGAGADSIDGGTGFNYLRGGDGNDTVQGGSGFDDINGNHGDDVVDGGSGGGDWLVGGQGNDLITSHASNDILYGNLGNDTLNGGVGDEIIRGGQGDDVLSGGAGNDWLSGDRGSDTITGGTGADTFHGFSGIGLDVVTDFTSSQGDKIQLDAGTHYTLSQSGADTIIDLGGGDEMILKNVQLASLPTGWIFTL